MRNIRIGIMYTPFNREDIAHYKKLLLRINERIKEASLVVIGYKPDEDKDGLMDDLEFDYVKPVSIIHYLKQLKSLRLNVLFIPCIRNEYNATSETLSKYMECALFRIPVIAPNIYPYNVEINPTINGFLYEDEDDVISTIDNAIKNDKYLIDAGNSVHAMVLNRYNLYISRTRKDDAGNDEPYMEDGNVHELIKTFTKENEQQ